jgi:acyl-CoA dehydrogenase
MSITQQDTETFISDVRSIATGVAALHADDVDRESRFPVEAIDALREAGAMSALVPVALGGSGLSLRTIARACYELSRGCSSTGMIFAMHQIQVATIVRHLNPGATWMEEYLDGLGAEQRLIASATSEIGTGGDMGRSIAAVTRGEDGGLRFEKRAPTVSYGAHSDDLLTSLRRSAQAEESDQVMVLTHTSETELEPTGTWDTIGMRGTCSPGFTVRAEFDEGQILDTPFSTMMNESIVPLSHIFWSHVWLGIATEAFGRGRSFVRELGRRAPGEPVPQAHSLARVMGELSLLRSEVEQALAQFEMWSTDEDRERLSTMAAILRFNNLKLAASEQAPRICADVLEVIGIMAYKNDSPFGVGRHLRDALSARLMVANQRICDVDAGLLMIAKDI